MGSKSCSRTGILPVPGQYGNAHRTGKMPVLLLWSLRASKRMSCKNGNRRKGAWPCAPTKNSRTPFGRGACVAAPSLGRASPAPTSKIHGVSPGHPLSETIGTGSTGVISPAFLRPPPREHNERTGQGIVPEHNIQNRATDRTHP